MSLQRRIVIYNRFSSDMQNPKSCADQEREIRDALTKMGIDHSDALVIHDEAESGTKTFRDEFARLVEMADQFQIDLGGPSRMDQWGPKIAEMRANGVPWKEIWKITGLGSGPAYVAWKRYVEAQDSRPDEPPAEPPQDQPEEDSGEHPDAA